MTDYAAITERQQAMWATGNFHRIGVSQVVVGELLVRSVGVRAHQRVLDIAAGAGNTALAAARRWAEVTATDYVPDLLATAERRAVAEGLPLTTGVADAQALPYDEASFDVVLSTFGIMFAPDQQQAADEALRVLVPGGRLGLACWTPGGFTGRMFALGAKHLPPPSGVLPPVRWGTEQGLQELLGDRAALQTRVEVAHFVYPSQQFMLEHFKTWFGPTALQFAALDDAGKLAYERDLIALYEEFNTATDGTVLIHSDYLEAVATLR